MQLASEGHIITSTWVLQRTSGYDNDVIMPSMVAGDIAEIERSEILLCLAKPGSSGGRFFEMGLAHGLDKIVIVVGKENDWDCVGEQVATVADAYTRIAEIEKSREVVVGNWRPGVVSFDAPYSGPALGSRWSECVTKGCQNPDCQR